MAVIDTEANRALHYADKFKFQHIPFGAPFGPLDYLSAIEFVVSKGVKVIVVDSMSHEHEGPGGVLEMHDAALDRMAGDDWKRREKCTFAAWIKPKSERRRLINTILQLGVSCVFCFRAKEKIAIVKGAEPTQLGWMPIGADEFVYEMTTNILLPPSSGGVPEWMPNEPGSKAIVKRPEQFLSLFAKRKPLDEDTGEAIAKWANGDGTPSEIPHPAPSPATATKDATAAIIERFADLGVTEKMILARLGLDSRNGITNAERATLTAIGKKVTAGESTIEKEFGVTK